MDIRGYGTGPVTADAAFTSDFAIPDDIPMQNLVDMVEIERRSMDVRPGMRHKYTHRGCEGGRQGSSRRCVALGHRAGAG